MNRFGFVLFYAGSCGLFLAGCGRPDEKDFLSSAVVEFQNYQVSPSIQGQIITATKEEGQRVDSGAVVAVIDTIPVRLKTEELVSAMAELQQQIASRQAELSASKSDIDGVERELRRVRGLTEKGSATQQQLDQLQTQSESAQMKLKASQLALSALSDRKETMRVQLLQLQDQLRRCFVVSPSSGVILTKYRDIGEMAGPVSPIYEIGKIDTMRVDFYVPQPVLSALSVGGAVFVRLDDQTKKDGIFLPAWISWVSPEAEFSPKNIQTRQARNELVFKVRALAPNSGGVLKRGLPVEVWRRMPVK